MSKALGRFARPPTEHDVCASAGCRAEAGRGGYCPRCQEEIDATREQPSRSGDASLAVAAVALALLAATVLWVIVQAVAR